MTPKSSQILHWSRASKLRCARESTWRALPRMVRAWKVAVRANSWFHTVSWHYSQQKSAWTRWRNAPCTGKNRFAAWRSTELACSRNDQTLTWSNPPLPSAKCWQWKGVDRVHPSKQTKPASLFACFPGPKPFEIAEIATLSIAMSSPDRSIARIATPAENTTETRPMTDLLDQQHSLLTKFLSYHTSLAHIFWICFNMFESYLFMFIPSNLLEVSLEKGRKTW